VRLAVSGKNLEVTDGLRSYCERRLRKLERFLPDQDATAQVVLSVQRQHQKVEVTVPLDGLLLRAEVADTSMYAAIDEVLDKLVRQIRKYKTRVQDQGRHRAARPGDAAEPGAARAAAGQAEAGGGETEATPGADGELLVRVKRHPLKPMAMEEALLQMNLLGHDFFVFRDAATDQVQVLYRRKQGGYGLIVGV
jgi:putative sigma-54 modulation protein